MQSCLTDFRITVTLDLSIKCVYNKKKTSFKARIKASISVLKKQHQDVKKNS